MKIYGNCLSQSSNAGEDVEDYGVSIFSFTSKNRMLVYYRGDTCVGDEIDFHKMKNYSQVRASFDNIMCCFHKCNTGKQCLDSYIRSHKGEIDESFNIITYCDESDLLQILYMLRQNPSAFGKYRVVQEMQLVPLCHNGTNDEIVVYEYSHLYSETQLGDGVVEILQTGFVESKKEYTTETHVKRLSLYESFVSLVLGSIVQYHIVEKSWEEDCVLLATMPFDIKVKIWIDKRYRDGFTLIEPNTSIPCKKIDTICDDGCSVVLCLLGKRFSFDEEELFGYKPNFVEICVDIDGNTKIDFVFRDKETNKEIPISQTEIFKYEV